MKHLIHQSQSVLLPSLSLSAILLLVGCATDAEPYPATFGDSVRQMIAVQTADPNYRAAGLDGDKAEAVLSAYREDVAKPKSVERQIIDIRL